MANLFFVPCVSGEACSTGREIWSFAIYQLYVVLLLQIRQLSDQGDGSINVMTKGKQRFRIYRVMTAPDGAVIFNLVACLWKHLCVDWGFQILAKMHSLC